MEAVGKIHSTKDCGKHITLYVDIKKEDWKAFDVAKLIKLSQEGGEGR